MKLYHKFLKQVDEIMDLPPQRVGPFTPYYKMLTKRLKVMPLPTLLVVSSLIAIAIYILLGPAVARIVSLLQRGF